MKIYKKDCSPIDAEDKTLPVNSYLVEYIENEITKYDIVISHKRVDVFDYYYDTLMSSNRNNEIVSIEWTNGRVSAILWTDPNQPPKKKSKS